MLLVVIKDGIMLLLVIKVDVVIVACVGGHNWK